MSTDEQRLVCKLNVSINNCHFDHNNEGVYSAITMEISYCLFENNFALQNAVSLLLKILFVLIYTF